MVSVGVKDVGVAGEAEEPDGGRSDRGHDAGRLAGADLGVVLVVSDVADPVQPVLDAPVSSDLRGQIEGSDGRRPAAMLSISRVSPAASWTHSPIVRERSRSRPQ